MSAAAQHAEALAALEDRAARLVDELSTIQVEYDLAVRASIEKEPADRPLGDLQGEPQKLLKRLRDRETELRSIEKELPIRQEIVSRFDAEARRQETVKRLAQAKTWAAEHAEHWAELTGLYDQLTAGYERLLGVEQRMQPWYQGNEAAAERDPEFGKAWQQVKHENDIENFSDSGNLEAAPLFPQGVAVLVRYLEKARHVVPPPVPAKYVWLVQDKNGAETGEVKVTTDHTAYQHLGWFRLGFEKAVGDGIISEDGKRIKEPAVAA